MRPVTITQAAEHYAGTGLTRTAIRRAIINGEVPSVRAGRKYLLTLEAIESWLHGGQHEQLKETEMSGIRPVKE